MRAAMLLALASLASAGGCAVLYGYSDYEEKAPEQTGPCETAADCPASDACITWSCVEGRCLGLVAPAGTSCGAADQCLDASTMQPGEVCDGTGVCVQPPARGCGADGCSSNECVSCVDASDCPTGRTCENGACASCKTCGQALQEGGAPDLCPGSSTLAEALISCVCEREHECTWSCSESEACGGTSGGDACGGCVFTNHVCDQEWEDCYQDDGHGG